MLFDMNFTNEGINILKKLARYEMMINHNLKKKKKQVILVLKILIFLADLVNCMAC